MSGIGLDLNDVLKREGEAEQLALGRERQRGPGAWQAHSTIAHTSSAVGIAPPRHSLARFSGNPKARSHGTSHLLLSPMELLEKLAALVPPARFHLLRYHGVL